MPLSLDPNRRVSIALKADPTRKYLAKFPTVRQRAEVQEAIEKAWSNADDETEESRILLDALCQVVVGWEGFPVPFSRETLAAESVGNLDLYELAGLCLSSTRLGDTDRKKSESPSVSNADGSASNADADGAKT